MAKVNDLIYVIKLCSATSPVTIRTYEGSIPYDLLMITLAEEMEFPNHMVGIENKSALYVSDWGMGCIWKIDLRTHKIYRWLNKSSNGLSVTNDNHLLLLRRWSWFLDIYNEDAQLVRSISLPYDFRAPFNKLTVQISNGDFIITHNMGGRLWKFVSFLSTDGKIITQFSLTAIKSSSHAQAFLDTHSNNLIVVELTNEDIYLFNPVTLIWNHAYGFENRPSIDSVFHDTKKRQLIVVLHSGAHIFTLNEG